MSWREQLLPGTFRGVRFGVESAERTGGRKAVVHEYPLQDEVYVEDLGRAPRGFQIECFVIGQSYFQGRDALIDALEQEGPGQLVHPYQGRKQVAVLSFRQSETAREGGGTFFSINFIETAQKASQPAAKTDFLSRVVTAAQDAVDSARSAFLEQYDVVAQAQFAVDSLSDTIGSAGTLIKQVIGGVLGVPQTLASFTGSIGGFIGDAASIARAPSDFADRLDLILSFGGQAASSRTAISALMKVYAFEPPFIPAAITSTRVKEHANQDAMTGLIRQRAVIEAARLAPAAKYNSYEDALATRNAILDGLDVVSETATDDVFATLGVLRAQIVRAVPGDDNALARLIQYTPPITLPDLVIAYDLYEDLSLEADMISRNKIRHPGFVPGGIALEVLSSA